MKHFVTAAALVLASLFSIVSATAQGAPDADTKEIQAYKLSMTTLKQFVTATRNVMAAIQQDPRYVRIEKLKAEMRALDEKEEPTDAEMERAGKLAAEIDSLEDGVPNPMSGATSLTEMERAIQKEPLIANALKSAGMPARDYAKFSLAFLQAYMIHGFQKGGVAQNLPKDLEAKVNMENVKFVADHGAEIAKLMVELEAMNKKN